MNTDYKNNKIYYPMLVSLDGNKNDKKDEILNLWDRFRSLPENIKNILSSEKIVDFIYGISKHYNLLESETENFSRIIRGYFLGEIVDGQFVRFVSQLCKTSGEEGLEILKAIKNISPINEVKEKRNLVTGEITKSNQNSTFQNFSKPKSSNFNSNKKIISSNFYSNQGKKVFEPQQNLVSKANFSQMPIKRAMKLFPKLDSQIITKTPIVSRKYLKPISPTIKNWLMIYEDFMGTSKKSAIERGNFLFQSDATKNLMETEKQKLALLLKSFDENFPLIVDRVKGEIIFTEFKNNQQNVSLNSNLSLDIEDEISDEKNIDQNNLNDENESDYLIDKNEKEVHDNSLNNFNYQSQSNNNIQNENQKNEMENFNFLNETNEDSFKFADKSNFNGQVFSSLAQSDSSELNSSKENVNFNPNYSIDELSKKVKDNNFDENLSFSPNRESGFDESNLSFTSNHVLPVEKNLLEKQRQGEN